MKKVKEIIRIIFGKNNEEDVKMKVKWSLKKKILVGLGILGTGALGIFAYGRKNAENIDDEDCFEDEDYDYGTDETENLDETDVAETEVEAQ